MCIRDRSDTNLVVDAPESVGKGQELVLSGTLLDIGGVPAAGQTIEFEIWEPNWQDNKPSNIRCNPSGWQRYRCDIGTAETDNFGNFVFNWTVPEDGQPDADDEYRIESLFPGSTYLYSSIITTELIILESTVNLTAEIAPSKEYIGENIWINGSVSESALSNGSITVELAGVQLAEIDVTQTNWSIQSFIPTDLAAGNYTVIVSFESSSATLPDERVNLDLVVLGTSEIILELDSLKVTRGELTTLEGELADHLGPVSYTHLTLPTNREV